MPNSPIPADGEAMPTTAAEAISFHEAKHAAWLATSADGELPEGTTEDEAAWAAELALVHFPCRTFDDVRTKVGYLYHAATDVARGARDTAQTNDFDGFLGSLLGISEGGEAATIPTPSAIPEMYEEWLAIRNKPISERSDDELDENPSRYQVLQAQIIAAEPQTPRDVAIMFIVDTDDTDSYHSDIFEARVRDIANGEPAAADPLLSAISDYRDAVKALNEIDIGDDITLAEENALFEATYGKEKDALIEAAPVATSIAGVREAIRLAFDEDAIDDMVAEGALRAALAYLDGRASA